MLLVPSLCEEAFGRVVIEAQLNCIPVLYHDIGGLREAAGQSAVSIEPPPFGGPIAFPEVRPDDLAVSVRKWSRAIDGIMATPPDPIMTKRVASHYLWSGEQAFSRWIERFEVPTQNRPIVVVAPHSDDAAFSVGGLLSEIGDRGIVVTLFSRSGFTARDGLEGDPDRVTMVRMREDREFTSAIRARLECCSLPEAALRHPGGFEDVFMASSDWSRLVAEENPDVLRAIDTALDGVLERHRPSLVLLPLGLGFHRDHLLALHLGAEAARRWDVGVAAYEDLPYAAELTESEIRFQSSKLGQVTPFYAPLRRGVTRKIELCHHYTSQITSDNISSIGVHAANLGGAERLWVTSPAAALALECTR